MADFKKARKEATKLWLEYITEALPGNDYVETSREYLEGLSDDEFLKVVELIEQGKFELPIHIPLFSEEEIDVDRLLGLGDKYGYNFYQPLEITDQKDPSVTYITPKKYIVTENIARRQAQTISAKISIPTDSNVIDDSTGQVTGDSKGSAFSLQEAKFMESKGLINSIYEFVAPLGGNNEAYQLMEQSIIETGMVTHQDIDTDEKPGVIDRVKVIMKSAHIGENF